MILILREDQGVCTSRTVLGNSDEQPSVGAQARGHRLVSDLPHNGCVTLGKSLTLSECQSPYL